MRNKLAELEERYNDIFEELKSPCSQDRKRYLGEQARSLVKDIEIEKEKKLRKMALLISRVKKLILLTLKVEIN
jgi:hypothetical protein